MKFLPGLLMLTSSAFLRGQDKVDSLTIPSVKNILPYNRSSVFDIRRPVEVDLLPWTKLSAGYIPSQLATGERAIGVSIDGRAFNKWMQYATGLYTEESLYTGTTGFVMQSGVSAKAFSARDHVSRLDVQMRINQFQRYGPLLAPGHTSGLLMGSQVKFGFERFEWTKETAWNTGRRIPGASDLLFNTTFGYNLGNQSQVLLRWSNYMPGLYRFYHPLWEAGIKFGQ